MLPMSSFTSDIVIAGICKKEAFVTVPAENSALVYSQGFTEYKTQMIVIITGK